MMQNPPSLLSLLSPRKMLEKERRKRRRMPIRMTISSMKRTIKSRRSFSLREETTMTSSAGIMTKISHSLRKRKRRRRSRNRHSTLDLKVGPPTLLLLLEEMMEKKELEVEANVENLSSMRKSKTLVALISR
jgi:hypothetical protein